MIASLTKSPSWEHVTLKQRLQNRTDSALHFFEIKNRQIKKTPNKTQLINVQIKSAK